MALSGHEAMQQPQSMHAFGLSTVGYFLPFTILALYTHGLTGHTSMHTPHPEHLFSSILDGIFAPHNFIISGYVLIN
jgi:hypothetical protein